MALQRRHGDVVRDHGRSTANELIVMCGHTGTHIDALGHFSEEGRCFGRRSAQELQSGARGLNELDIASVAPIVCRGVLLDIAGLKGVAVLPGGYAVTGDDLAAAERRQGVTVAEGDAVLIRTGWIAYFDDVARFRGLDTGTPGPDPSAAAWLAERRARLTGDETISYEVIRPGDEWLPVHAALLVHAGIHIVEVMNLEELARDGVHEFLFVCSPLRFVGGTGSPIRPLAVAWR
jgi:kynurenine formamidase